MYSSTDNLQIWHTRSWKSTFWQQVGCHGWNNTSIMRIILPAAISPSSRNNGTTKCFLPLRQTPCAFMQEAQPLNVYWLFKSPDSWQDWSKSNVDWSDTNNQQEWPDCKQHYRLWRVDIWSKVVALVDKIFSLVSTWTPVGSVWPPVRKKVKSMSGIDSLNYSNKLCAQIWHFPHHQPRCQRLEKCRNMRDEKGWWNGNDINQRVSLPIPKAKPLKHNICCWLWENRNSGWTLHSGIRKEERIIYGEPEGSMLMLN